MLDEGNSVMQIIGGGFVFTLWFLIVSFYYGEGSYLILGFVGVGAIAFIIFGMQIRINSGRSALLKVIVIMIAAILLAIICLASWSLHTADPLGISLFFASTAVATIAAFVFISGVKKIFQTTNWNGK